MKYLERLQHELARANGHETFEALMKSEFKKENDKRRGFFDLPEDKKTCRDPEHNPPMHIVIPQGKFYRHICPGCGNAIEIMPSRITF